MTAEFGKPDRTLWDAFDAITKALSPDDPTRHIPNCGYSEDVPTCPCADFGGALHQALREALARAWAEGFDAGEQDVLNHDREDWDAPCIPNPYRLNPPDQRT